MTGTPDTPLSAGTAPSPRGARCWSLPWSAPPTPRCRSTACSARSPASTARRSGRAGPRAGARADRHRPLRRQRGAGLPWRFEPVQTTMTVKLGENAAGLLPRHQHLRPADRRPPPPTTSCPRSPASYFNKIECFCFTEQVLEPGQTAELPLNFFIDPEIVTDKDAKRVTHDHAVLHLLSHGGDAGGVAETADRQVGIAPLQRKRTPSGAQGRRTRTTDRWPTPTPRSITTITW